MQASKETKNPVDGVRKNDIEIGESHTEKTVKVKPERGETYHQPLQHVSHL